MASAKKYYYRNLRARKCPVCGGKRDAEGILCRRCLGENNRRRLSLPQNLKTIHQARYRARNKKEGLCPEDGRVPAPGRTYCQGCLDYMKERRQAKLLTKVKPQAHNESQRRELCPARLERLTAIP